MPRKLELMRQEAEFLVELTDPLYHLNHMARDINDDLRQQWGMSSREVELAHVRESGRLDADAFLKAYGEPLVKPQDGDTKQ